jgi:hypothetical protein
LNGVRCKAPVAVTLAISVCIVRTSSASTPNGGGVLTNCAPTSIAQEARSN